MLIKTVLVLIIYVSRSCPLRIVGRLVSMAAVFGGENNKWQELQIIQEWKDGTATATLADICSCQCQEQQCSAASKQKHEQHLSATAEPRSLQRLSTASSTTNWCRRHMPATTSSKQQPPFKTQLAEIHVIISNVSRQQLVQHGGSCSANLQQEGVQYAEDFRPLVPACVGHRLEGSSAGSPTSAAASTATEEQANYRHHNGEYQTEGNPMTNARETTEVPLLKRRHVYCNDYNDDDDGDDNDTDNYHNHSSNLISNWGGYVYCSQGCRRSAKSIAIIVQFDPD